MKSLFYNKTGEVSAYGLACGYIERINTDKEWKELYMEHDHYHVRSGKQGERYSLWETFSSNELAKARKLYRNLKTN